MIDLEEFKNCLINDGKSDNTIKSYIINLKEYIKWFKESFGLELIKLHRDNVIEYKTYLINVKKFKGRNLNGRTINAKISSLVSLNRFLVNKGIQNEFVVDKKDSIKIQTQYANPCQIEKKDVEILRQRILEDGDLRLYAIVTLISYTGVRITEALNILLNDVCFEAKEILIRKGKGNKQRIVYLNNKVIQALRSYIKVRRTEGKSLFVSRENDNLSRSVVNREFQKYSNVVTPHMLRHYYCSHALDMGYTIADVANQVGHRDVRTTLLYTNPSIKKLKDMAELL